jgi:hypothetical protein
MEAAATAKDVLLDHRLADAVASPIYRKLIPSVCLSRSTSTHLVHR